MLDRDSGVLANKSAPGAAGADGLKQSLGNDFWRSRIPYVCEVIVFDSGGHSRHADIRDAELSCEWADVESGVLDGFYTVDGEVLTPSRAADGIYIRLERTGAIARAELGGRMVRSCSYPLDRPRDTQWGRVPAGVSAALTRALSNNPPTPEEGASDADWTAWVNLQDVRSVLAGRPAARHADQWLADLQTALARPGVQELMGPAIEGARTVAQWLATTRKAH